jgi:methyltransferase (TIGR00027 family)
VTAVEPDGAGGRQPSFMAMWHAWLRHHHATTHASPILRDTRSIELVPDDVHERVLAAMTVFSAPTADALVTMAVIRHRLLADRLPLLHERRVRQLVILGAGLDATVLIQPEALADWRVFEVDEPATQEWKRQRMAGLGWPFPPNLVFAPCDFERTGVLSALEAVGFDRGEPALVSLFGVILYLTADATATLLRTLATLAPGSEVMLTYSPPSDGSDPVAQEVWDGASSTAAAAGETFLNYYRASEIERLLLDSGFRHAIHHPNDALSKQYFADRPDGLRLATIEQLITGVC